MRAKVIIARRLLGGRLAFWDNKAKRNRPVPLFDNLIWNARRAAIADRVQRHQSAAHERAIKRQSIKTQ